MHRQHHALAAGVTGMNLRGGLLIGLRRGYWLAAKLSDKKFRVCRLWTSPVQNVAGGSSVSQLSFCDTVRT
jgi:hypothetical protein